MKPLPAVYGMSGCFAQCRRELNMKRLATAQDGQLTSPHTGVAATQQSRKRACFPYAMLIQTQQHIARQKSCCLSRAVRRDCGYESCRFLLQLVPHSQRGRERHGQYFNTQISWFAASFEIFQELSHDAAGNGKAKATSNHGIHPYHAAARVGEWTSGIAGIESNVRLDDFDSVESGAAPLAIWARLLFRFCRLESNILIGGSTCGNDAEGHGAFASERVSDCDDQLTHAKSGRISNLCGVERFPRAGGGKHERRQIDRGITSPKACRSAFSIRQFHAESILSCGEHYMSISHNDRRIGVGRRSRRPVLPDYTGADAPLTYLYLNDTLTHFSGNVGQPA
jgi:hypothetical protein